MILVTGAIAILSGAAVWLLAVIAAVQGATHAPVSASMRALWARLVPEEALEAVSVRRIQLELVFVVGPLIAAGLATALSPAVSLVLCAGLYAAAAVGFATAPAARSRDGRARGADTRGGAAISFGGLEVALTAFAEEEGSRARRAR